MKNTTYNGYTNYETWLACLWFENNENVYNAINATLKAVHNEVNNIPEENKIDFITLSLESYFDVLRYSVEGAKEDLNKIEKAKVDFRGLAEMYYEEVE